MAKRGRPRHPDILTPREWEVLALLRDGLTNDRIAARLEITERTARYHVSEILSKLGVSTRQEAASWSPEERRPWWAVLGAPVAFARRLPFAWAPAVLALAVVTALAVGAGLLAWGLVTTEGDAGSALRSSAQTNTAAPLSAEALSDSGAPTTFILAPGGLRPIDPATGEDLPGYESLFGWEPFAIAPDGRVAAVGRLRAEPAGLELVDLQSWRSTGDLDVPAPFAELQWSRDGRLLYGRTVEQCVTTPEGTRTSCQSDIVTIDVTQRRVLARVVSPTAPLFSYLAPDGPTFAPAPDGSALYLLAAGVTDPSSARLVAFDPLAGTVREEIALPEVWYGPRPAPGEPPERVVDYYPALAVSPDGGRAYVVHAGSDRITAIDLHEMRVERSQQVRRRASLIERFLSLLADTAHADGRSPFYEKWATISADGRYLYVGGGSAAREDEFWAVGVYPSESAGLRVIDTESLEIVAQIEPGAECEYTDLLVHPSERYLFAIARPTDPGQTGVPTCDQAGLVVLDPETLDAIARRPTGGQVQVFVAPVEGSGAVEQ